MVTMAKICEVTKRGSIVGGGYSNRTRATKFNPTGKSRKYINLQKKKVFVPELGKSVIVTVSTKGLRTMKKNGVYSTLKKAGLVK
jgi:large subunit ribosomal protein L28